MIEIHDAHCMISVKVFHAITLYFPKWNNDYYNPQWSYSQVSSLHHLSMGVFLKHWLSVSVEETIKWVFAHLPHGFVLACAWWLVIEKGGEFAVTKSWLTYVFVSVLFPWYFHGNQWLTWGDGQTVLWITQLKKEHFLKMLSHLRCCIELCWDEDKDTDCPCLAC